MDGQDLSKASRAKPAGRRPGDLLARTVGALWRSRYLILLSALAAGTAAFVGASLSPPVYQARATLLLQRPAFSTELKPKPLSIETYQSIIKSDFVISKLLSRLIKDKVLPPETPLETLDDRISVEIFAHRATDRPGAKEYIPLLDLVATADRPATAAKIANIWAEVFLNESAGLVGQLKQSSLTFIETQYPAISKTLEEKEDILRKKEDFYDQSLLELQQRLEMKVLTEKQKNSRELSDLRNQTARREADYINESTRLLNEYRQETERLKLEFLNRWKPDLLKGELELKTAKMVDLQNKALDLDLAIKTEKDKLELLKQEIRQQPRFLVLSKAITDEALWNQIGAERSGQTLEKLKDLKLQTEEVNPAHSQLLEQLIETQIRYETLGPQRDHLTVELGKYGSEIDRLTNLVTEKQIELDALLKARELGLATLGKDRETGLASLVNDHKVELEALEERNETEEMLLEQSKESALAKLTRERTVMVGQLRREKESAGETYKLLAEKYEAAHLARAEASSDITLGGQAIPPERPTPSGRALKTLLALLAGLMISVLVIGSIEYLRFIRVLERLQVKPVDTAGVNVETAAPRSRPASYG